MPNLKTNEDLISDIDFAIRLHILFLVTSFVLFMLAFIFKNIDIGFFTMAIFSLGLSIIFEIQRNADIIRLEMRIK